MLNLLSLLGKGRGIPVLPVTLPGVWISLYEVIYLLYDACFIIYCYYLQYYLHTKP